MKLNFKESILNLMYMCFASVLVAANAMAAKQIPIGNWFGVDISITVGIICYPITFLITDIIGELYGKEAAKKAVVGGLIGQVIAMLFIVVANLIPSNSEEMNANFNSILGSNWILTFGSLLACFLSQSWDVWIFHKIRDKYINKHGSTKGGRWIWNNASTMTSQLIDSVVFYIFLILMLHTQGYDMPFHTSVITIFAYWVVKIIIAALDTPIFYLCTNNWRKKDVK